MTAVAVVLAPNRKADYETQSIFSV